MGRKKTISVQVNAVISVTWKSDSKNPLKAFKKSARYRQDFPFCLSCPRSLAFLNALCAWGIHQTQHREAQHISILLCTSHPWGQGPVTPLSPSPIFAQHTLSSHHFFFHISLSIRKPFALACFFIFSFTCLLQDKLQHWFYHKIMLIGSINHNDYIKVSVLHPPGLQKVL